MSFRDRTDAGRQLASKLSRYRARSDVVVLALPRGGVPVGFEVAAALGAPLDVLVVRRLVAPRSHAETLGAVAGAGVRVIDRDLCLALCLSDAMVAKMAEREEAEVERRDRVYRDCHPRLEIRGRTVILVDDGIATGASMRAAVLTVERCDPAGIVVAVPVASSATSAELTPRVREFVYCYIRDPVYAVSLWYDTYAPVSDDDVCQLLRRADAALVQPAGSRSLTAGGTSAGPRRVARRRAVR